MKTREIVPFGLEVTGEAPERGFVELSARQICDWVAVHRVAVFRNFILESDDEMLAICSALGDILHWEFGAVNELKVVADSANYLYTNHDVPFHWDGAFVGRIPHYIFFHCLESPEEDCGGETTFCNTVQLLADTSAEERESWNNIRVTYSTEKLVHYGGSFTSQLVAAHPVSGDPVIRYAEPVDDLNPVRLQVDGLPDDQHPMFFDRMKQLLYTPAYCYEHAWRSGDIIIADNHALLHGRRAYRKSANRHLRRVNIL